MSSLIFRIAARMRLRSMSLHIDAAPRVSPAEERRRSAAATVSGAYLSWSSSAAATGVNARIGGRASQTRSRTFRRQMPIPSIGEAPATYRGGDLLAGAANEGE